MEEIIKVVQNMQLKKSTRMVGCTAEKTKKLCRK